MHRLATIPGGWEPGEDGVVFVEQTPAPIVLLTAADTDIQAIAQALPHLPPDFPALRIANFLHLQQPLSIDTYANDVLQSAQVIILRLLGGRAYWPYGLEVVQDLIQHTQASLFVLPGDDRPDPDLSSHSTVPLIQVHQLWRYFVEGGPENLRQALLFVADTCLQRTYGFQAPQAIPAVGLYPVIPHPTSPPPNPFPQVGILFYRSHYLAGNTAPIDHLCQALWQRQLMPVPLFVSSLRDPDIQEEVLNYFQPKGTSGIEVVLNTTSFAIAEITSTSNTTHKVSHSPSLWHQLNVPILQVILSSGTIEQWQSHPRGLSPRDMAMNVALPEMDGRIISRAISFKAVQTYHAQLETDVVTYEPVADRIQFVVDLAAAWVRLRQTAVSDRKIALILANYPTRDGRLANGVGLDTPASCVAILQAMQAAGYHLSHCPDSSDDLMQRLTTGITNDPESKEIRAIYQSLAITEYAAYFASLPEAIQASVQQRYGSLSEQTCDLPVPGIQLGNIFVGIQPSRGYDRDPTLNYHAPDLEPTHDYLAFYQWLRSTFGAQAIVHVGKHGNLEWLPGKGIALSETCYPEIALAAMPHLYPFIVNDPGEGSQAKRRAQAVILDHLTPPMTRAELYGNLQQLEALVDEYYEAQHLDPSRLPLLKTKILECLLDEKLHQDLGIELESNSATSQNSLLKQFQQSFNDRLLPSIDTYLCELKEAQIRDGLHIFGQCPQGRQLRDLIIAIARSPGPGRLGLTRAIAQDWGWNFDPLTTTPSDRFSAQYPTISDAISAIEDHAAYLIDLLLTHSPTPPLPHSPSHSHPSIPPTTAPPHGPSTQTELTWIQTTLLPALQQTPDEIHHLLRGLNGEYIPPGASGAPTRGRSDVLPTGRNFYSVDIRAIPTETAWQVGRQAAEALIERYTQDHGEYPKTLGLSIWGTSTMRTGGDDMAEALALLGVQPVWDGLARRVVDFEILPLSLLGRPRVDVTLRISGFFRDAFANLIDLFDQAVIAISALNEPAEQNPLAARVQEETQYWQTQGLALAQAQTRSRYRIFGSKPGAYGAGLQGLIEAQNWTTDDDLAQAYINWSSYAYTGQGLGKSDPEAFQQRLSQMQVVLHNQDNREHDLLDSDDYYQFQGGLTAAVRSLQGHNPTIYFGDHSQPNQPKIRKLQEEIARVYRSRVVNPKWIAGVMRHGYKGAFELAATVDYLFAYDVTTHCVSDHMYQGITDSYLLDPTVQTFIQTKNPWALRDMAERLLEAHQRGFWQTANSQTLNQLRNLVLQAEGEIESIGGVAWLSQTN